MYLMEKKRPLDGSLGARLWLLAGLVLVVSACASRSPEAEFAELASSPWALESATVAGPVAAWRHHAFPGKRPSIYRYARLDGRDAVLVRAASSASMLRHTVRIEPGQLGQLRFSWKVPALITAADLSARDKSDSPVRIVLAFEGDRSRFSARDALLSELAHALTGEPMPYATLMYVWSNRGEPGTVVENPRTGRIRKMLLEAGPGKLGQWLDYERDVNADFVKAFGEPPGALVAIGIMTDTDNTKSTTQAWYGPVRHVRAATPDRTLAEQ